LKDGIREKILGFNAKAFYTVENPRILLLRSSKGPNLPYRDGL
jgi:hypothetical protein